ncbi:MAG: carboxypeptidase-like regulatory domain-containing protein, partial [Candidatus Hydrogenedentota bacterium]
MNRSSWTAALALALTASMATANAESITGTIVDASGKPMEGVTVSAFDDVLEQSISVFTQANGTYTIDGLHDATFNVRARLLGQLDVWQNDVDPGTEGVEFSMAPATGDDLEAQRTADSAFSMLKWDNAKDKENFKMMCTYCHQVGTAGFRAPEEPVDWETMITRMDGFGGLYKHTQDTLVKRLVETYSEEAVAD